MPTTDPHDAEFELDLTDLPDAPPEQMESPPWEVEPSGVTPSERLIDILAPYSHETVTKARTLIQRDEVELFKEEGQARWYNVKGSRLYVCKITGGEDFLFAECSCPNGQHRGGDAICYHSIAARVMYYDLGPTWRAWRFADNAGDEDD